MKNFCEHVLDFIPLIMHTTKNIYQYHVHWKSQKVYLFNWLNFKSSIVMKYM